MTQDIDDQRISDYNRGVLEGMKHQTMSPDTEKEITELKSEWAAFKARALSILIGAVVVVGGYGIWVGNIQTELAQISRSVYSNDEENARFDARLGSLEVNNGEIKTKLINIEATLQEIKVSVGRIR